MVKGVTPEKLIKLSENTLSKNVGSGGKIRLCENSWKLWNERNEIANFKRFLEKQNKICFTVSSVEREKGSKKTRRTSETSNVFKMICQ